MSLKYRLIIGFALLILSNVLLTAIAIHSHVTLELTVSILLGAGLLVAGCVYAWILEPVRDAYKALDSGIHSFQDGEYSFRLAPAPHPEVQPLFDFFNRLGEEFHRNHTVGYQQEMLLDTVIQGAPMAIILFGPTERVVLANLAARDLFRLGGPLKGVSFEQMRQAAPPQFAEALDLEHDTLFTVVQEGEAHSYHLSQRDFQLNAARHKLIIVKRLTREMQRQEVASWKKLIRLINHELNNALAPVRSLVHSARAILAHPEQHHKLDRIFDTLDATTSRLANFLESYAVFARLPQPNLREVHWPTFLEELGSLYPFSCTNRLKTAYGKFDPDQMQQALINLVKNAHEAGDPKPQLFLDDGPEGSTLIRLCDRGKGLSEQAMEKALLPFYSTKKTGTGLGLPLCREVVESHGGTLRLRARTEGGLEIQIRLP